MSMQIRIYDVEHGSCSHVISPNGKHFLFDIGTMANESISEFLKNAYFKNNTTPDFLCITHPHIDHIKDLPNMKKHRIMPKVLLRNKGAFPIDILSEDNEQVTEIKGFANQMNQDYCGEVSDLNNPEIPLNNGGISIAKFYPEETDLNHDDPNSFSCVIVLEYRNFKFVVTGDNPPENLKKMLSRVDFCKKISNATVLLAPHHGRTGDFCKEFVKVVNPLLTICSDKTIKHGTQEGSAQLYGDLSVGVKWNGLNRKVFTTRNDGTINILFHDDDKLYISTSSETKYQVAVGNRN